MSVSHIRHWLTSLLAVALAMIPTAPVTAAPSATTGADALPPAFGAQFHGTWDMYFTRSGGATPNAMFFAHLDQLAAHGVRLVRVDVGWSTSQPRKDSLTRAHWYNRRVDRVLDEAAKRNLQVLLTLHQSPAWSRPNSPGGVKRFPDDPASITPWARWMAREFGDRVTAWEVWNEPNLGEFTGLATVEERARRYVPLLRATAEGLREGDADARVVFGGPAQTDDVFVRRCYELGAKPYFDVMSVHPYQGNQTKPPESTDLATKARMTHLPTVLDAMADHGDAAKPVWWTEFGFSTHSNEGVPRGHVWRFGVPDDGVSADYLRRSFELARQRYPQVKVAIVYTAYKPPSDTHGHQYGYRLLEADGTPRAQLPTLRDYFSGFPGTRSVE